MQRCLMIVGQEQEGTQYAPRIAGNQIDELGTVVLRSQAGGKVEREKSNLGLVRAHDRTQEHAPFTR